jgi:CRISPR-associated protein Cas1
MKEHTRYIFSSGELSRKDFSILFKNEKGNFYIPIKDTREIYCFGEITVTSKLLEVVAKAGITIHFFNYYGNYVGSFYPKDYLISGRLTVKQSQAYLSHQNMIAISFVNGIAGNIHEVLYHYYRHDKKELKPLLDWLKNEVPRMLKLAEGIKQVLMIEGQIWSRFYDSFAIFLPADFILNKRVKRPPDNPMNALISFGNSLLYTKTISQIYHTHLNQSISFLHEPGEGRFSLSLDLSEVFKPVIVFRTIFDCVNNRKLQVEKHFTKELNYCLLNETGKKIFIEAFEDRINQVFEHARLRRKTTFKNAIKLDGYKLVKFLMEGVEFKPFSLEECK